MSSFDGGVAATVRRVLLGACASLALLGGPQAYAQNAVNTATITPPAGVTNPGTACAAAGGTFTPATGACSATDSDPIVAPQLTLAKTHAGDFVVGGNGVYTLTPGNTGSAPTSGTLTISDTLPNGLTYVSGTGTGWTCSAAGQVVTCTSTTPIAANSTGNPITLTVAVAAAAVPSVTNSARISGGGDATCPATGATQARCTPSDPTTVVQSRITTIKTANPASGTIVSPGQTITYTVTATITGAPPPVDVPLSDTLGPGLTLVAVPPGDCSVSGQVLTCNVPAGTAVGDYVVSYSATVDAGATGTVGNNVTGGDGCGTPGGCSTTHPVAAPALTIDKSAGAPTGATAGDTIPYTFVVTNTGNVTLTGIVVNDAQLDAPATCDVTTLAPTAVATCTGVHTITQAEVNAGQSNNSATASGTPPGGGTTTSPPDTTTTPLAPAPALTLVKTAATPVDVNGNGLTDAGDTIDYSFSVTNTGNVTLDNVVINDAKLSPTPIACAATLAPGASANCGPVTYTVTTADEAAGSVDNSATASGTPPGGGTTTSPPSTTSTPVTGPATTSVVKTADPAAGTTVRPGDTITYTLTTTVSGNPLTQALTLTDTLSANQTFGAVTSAGAYACSGALTCVLPAGTAPGTYAVSYTATVNADATGNVGNSVVASNPPGGDPDPTCTTCTTDHPVTAATTSVVKTSDPATGTTVAPGQTITYTLTTTVAGAALSQDLTLADTLSANQTFGTVTSAGAYACSGALTCVLPAGTAPGTYAVSYTATVNADATGNVGNSVAASNPPGGDPDPTCTTCTTDHQVGRPSLSTLKAMTGYTDADGDGAIGVGDTLNYTVTVTNTGNVPLNNVTIDDAMLTPSSATCPLVPPNGTCVLTGTYVVTQADADAGQVVNTALVTSEPPPGGPPLPPEACPTGSSDPRCAPTVTTPVTQRPAIATAKTATLTTDNGTQGVGNTGDVITYAVTVTNTGNVTLGNITVTDSFDGNPPTTLTCAPTTLVPGAVATCDSYTHTITAAEANSGKQTLDNSVTATGQTTGGTSTTVTATSTASINIEPDPTTVRITKTASPREIKVGDLVRYTLVLQNTGAGAVVDGTLVDTPPAGFTYVDNSLDVADADGAGRLAGTYPIRVDQIDIAAGDRATVTYLLRVGAGVRPGIHRNSAYLEDDGAPVSNVATADVQMVADPLLDESLILGTVFDDRDGDGWQDSAAMAGVRVQGGFAPNAYVPNSTTIDRGDGPAPQADASAPLLHGIDLGEISGRQSDADPAAAHRVVVGQTLRSLDFTDDFVLTTKQGVSLRMDAAGNTRVERSEGEAAKGRTSAEPSVERRVSAVDGGYRVDYVIDNAGVDERGIPGVRIASVEGLLIETDQFGRYHLVGIPGGPWERGRNFILKVDPATLPPGSVFTTDNPLLRRITPGLPVRFDFGVKLPPGLVEGGEQTVEMELGAVMFDAESAKLRDEYLPVIDKMAEQVRAHDGGEVVIAANGESQQIAYDRARAVQAALLDKLTPEQAKTLKVSLWTDLDDPDSTVLSLGEAPVLGTLLFDTDKATIRPEFAPLVDRIADDIGKLAANAEAPLVIGVVGHADKRGSDAYNVALGLRRAKAVYEAIAAKLDPAVRSRLRVQVSDDPTAPLDYSPSTGSPTNKMPPDDRKPSEDAQPEGQP